MSMMLKKTTLLLFFSFFIGTFSYAQHIAVSNNLLFDLAGAFSAGVEIPLSNRTSVEAYGSIRPWKRSDDNVHKHWLVQAQYRIWPCQVMNGFFFGPYAHFGEYNLGNQTVLFGLLNGLKPYRYEGWLAGAGIGIGYEYALAKHWNMEFEIGAGAIYSISDSFECDVCNRPKDTGVKHLRPAITKAALSIVYVF